MLESFGDVLVPALLRERVQQNTAVAFDKCTRQKFCICR